MRRFALPLLLTLLSTSPLWAADHTPTTVGSLKIEKHGDHGQPIVLIPGLGGGPWVWQDTIDHLEKDHVVYALKIGRAHV